MSTCGSSIGAAQAHAAHPDFLTYPIFDEALAYQSTVWRIRSPSRLRACLAIL
jgi:hypothetical protein